MEGKRLVKFDLFDKKKIYIYIASLGKILIARLGQYKITSDLKINAIENGMIKVPIPERYIWL